MDPEGEGLRVKIRCKTCYLVVGHSKNFEERKNIVYKDSKELPLNYLLQNSGICVVPQLPTWEGNPRINSC